MKRSGIGIAFAITFLLAFIRQLGAEEAWPQFRGPTGQGISSARNLPVKWSAKSNVVWKTPLPGKGWSSPVLWDGRLYLTSAVDGKEGARHARCLLVGRLARPRGRVVEFS